MVKVSDDTQQISGSHFINATERIFMRIYMAHEKKEILTNWELEDLFIKNNKFLPTFLNVSTLLKVNITCDTKYII